MYCYFYFEITSPYEYITRSDIFRGCETIQAGHIQMERRYINFPYQFYITHVAMCVLLCDRFPYWHSIFSRSTDLLSPRSKSTWIPANMWILYFCGAKPRSKLTLFCGRAVQPANLTAPPNTALWRTFPPLPGRTSGKHME